MGYWLLCMSDGGAFRVATDAFSGPLELLLYLIEKHEVDIFDIPIALITEQYLIHIEALEGADMETLSAFLLMAATLLDIKARTLLPGKPSDNEALDDPRETLVMQLLQYKRFKELSGILAEREFLGIRAYYKEHDETVPVKQEENPAEVELYGVVTPAKLRNIFAELLLRQDRRVDKVREGFSGVVRERFTVAGCMAKITGALAKGRNVGFQSLFGRDTSFDEKVTTFLALLELIRLNRVRATQKGPFDEIICVLR